MKPHFISAHTDSKKGNGISCEIDILAQEIPFPAKVELRFQDQILYFLATSSGGLQHEAVFLHAFPCGCVSKTKRKTFYMPNEAIWCMLAVCDSHDSNDCVVSVHPQRVRANLLGQPGTQVLQICGGDSVVMRISADESFLLNQWVTEGVLPLPELIEKTRADSTHKVWVN